MIECSEHPDNERTCIYCLNEVIAQRDDRERGWRQAEARLREVSILLHQCFAHARRFRDQELSTPALERDWERVACDIRQTLAEELPPSEQQDSGTSECALCHGPVAGWSAEVGATGLLYHQRCYREVTSR